MQYAARHLFTIREKNEFESFSHIQVKIQVYQLYFTRFNIFFSFYPFDQSWKKILRFLDRKSSSSKIGSQYQESIIGIHRMIRGLLIKSCSAAGAKNFSNYVFCHRCQGQGPFTNVVSSFLRCLTPPPLSPSLTIQAMYRLIQQCV